MSITTDEAGERYMKTGEILPDSALEEFKKFNAILLGAVGRPDVKPCILQVGILVETRFALDRSTGLPSLTLHRLLLRFSNRCTRGLGPPEWLDS
ncbi:MAG: hypothetical protein JXP73_11505 [Deltaproteobacteria bacterium]|nr:hypothetical protein [Deltaproteobacteria bacterium]